MKLKSLIVVAACTLCAANLSAQSLSYKVEGSVSGLPDGTVVVLNPVSTLQEPDMATATVSGGKFEFSGTVAEPTAVRLMVKDTWAFKALVLGDAPIKVTGEAKPMSTKDGQSYSLAGVKAEGSAWTDKYNAILMSRDYLDYLYESNSEVFKDYTEAYGKARVAKDRAKCDSLSRTPLGRACGMADSIFFKRVEQTYHKALTDNKDSFLGPLSMVSLFAYLTPEQRPWYDELSDEAKNSQYGKMVAKDVVHESKVGQQAPELAVTNDKGKKLTLKSLAKGKKYVLVDFWASWCQPCRKEIPNVKAQYAKYAKKGFEVVSISIDKSDAAWRKAVKEEQLEWPNFRDTDGTLSKAWEVKAVPTMYLLSADGKVVLEEARGELLAYKLAELFK